MATMFLTAALAAPPEPAERQVIFSGSLQGHETAVFQPPATLTVEGSGAGIGAHIGQFTLTWKVTVDLSAGLGIGPYHLIAANGDSIFTTAVGRDAPSDTPGINRLVEIHTITGGTGRFAGAKGGFTVERLIDLATSTTSGSFHGTITSPAAAH